MKIPCQGCKSDKAGEVEVFHEFEEALKCGERIEIHFI